MLHCRLQIFSLHDRSETVENDSTDRRGSFLLVRRSITSPACIVPFGGVGEFRQVFRHCVFSALVIFVGREPFIRISRRFPRLRTGLRRRVPWVVGSFQLLVCLYLRHSRGSFFCCVFVFGLGVGVGRRGRIRRSRVFGRVCVGIAVLVLARRVVRRRRLCVCRAFPSNQCDVNACEGKSVGAGREARDPVGGSRAK